MFVLFEVAFVNFYL